jgi:hypothetical protein
LRQILLSAFFFLVAFQIYIFLFLKDMNTALLAKGVFSADNFWSVFQSQLHGATGGHFKKFMFPALPLEQLINWRLNYIFLLFINFPSVILPLGFFGIWRLFKNSNERLIFTFLFWALVSQIVWSANYIIWDMYAFGMPVWLMFGFLGTYGLAQIWPSDRLLPKLLKLLIPTIVISPILYAVVPIWAKSPGFWQSYFNNFVDVSNYWNTADYFGNPNKRNYILVDRLAEAMFSELPKGAYLLDSDGKGHYPFGFYYQNVLGRRPDVTILPIFTPIFDEHIAQRLAKDIFSLLESGAPVYISSVSYPERGVLNHLFGLLSDPPRNTPFYASGLDTSNLLSNFPNYELRKVVLLPDTGANIYKFVRREPVSPDKKIMGLVEGESLRLTGAGGGRCFPQGLGHGWSGGGHILCIDNSMGDRVDYAFELPRDFIGDLSLKFTKSFDFGLVSVEIDGREIISEIDLYSPTTTVGEVIKLSKLELKRGKHLMTFRIVGKNTLAESRYGFGLDYMEFGMTS